MGYSQLKAAVISHGILSTSDCETILKTCGSTSGAFAKGILALGLMNEQELADFISKNSGCARAASSDLENPQQDALEVCTPQIAEKLEVVPIRIEDKTLNVAMIDPLDRATKRQLEFFTGFKVKAFTATPSQVRTFLGKNIPNYKHRPTSLEKFLNEHMPKDTTPRDELQKGKQSERSIKHSVAMPPVTETPKTPTSDEELDLSSPNVTDTTLDNLKALEGDQTIEKEALVSQDSVPPALETQVPAESIPQETAEVAIQEPEILTSNPIDEVPINIDSVPIDINEAPIDASTEITTEISSEVDPQIEVPEETTPSPELAEEVAFSTDEAAIIKTESDLFEDLDKLSSSNEGIDTISEADSPTLRVSDASISDSPEKSADPQKINLCLLKAQFCNTIPELNTELEKHLHELFTKFLCLQIEPSLTLIKEWNSKTDSEAFNLTNLPQEAFISLAAGFHTIDTAPNDIKTYLQPLSFSSVLKSETLNSKTFVILLDDPYRILNLEGWREGLKSLLQRLQNLSN